MGPSGASDLVAMSLELRVKGSSVPSIAAAIDSHDPGEWPQHRPGHGDGRAPDPLRVKFAILWSAPAIA